MMMVQSPPSLLASKMAPLAQEVDIVSPVWVRYNTNSKACHFAALKGDRVPKSLHNQGFLDDSHMTLMTLDENRHVIDVLGGKFKPQITE